MKAFIYRRKSTDDSHRQVLSLENQHRAIDRLLAMHPELEIVGDLGESRSAATPGRPVFNDMIARIEAGEADAIVAWAPDRLSRNPIDAGRIIDLLDRRVLKHLLFSTYTFENNPSGIFMLQMMLVQSKYFSDSLSVNVRLGIQTKVENGWRPGNLPIGYLHDRATKTVVRHPVHFPLIEQMFVLAGYLRPTEIHAIARDEWGLTTVQSARSGGNALTLGAIYKILRNPFYAGLMLWKGALLPGKQEPAVSMEAWDEIQRRLRRPGKARPQRHRFAFTGLISCACGLMVTAERKVNRHGSAYVYYRCTRRRRIGRCRHPAVTADALHQQLVQFLASITLHPRLHRWAVEFSRTDDARLRDVAAARRHATSLSLADATRQLAELTRLRLRSLITDEEFLSERSRLEKQRLGMEIAIAQTDDEQKRIEPVLDVIWFSIQAVDWFLNGDDAVRRLIVETAGSHPVLSDKTLSIQAAKPFVLTPFFGSFIQLCRLGEGVHTPAVKDIAVPTECPKELKPEIRKYIRSVSKALMEPDGQRISRNIKRLRALCERPSQADEAA